MSEKIRVKKRRKKKSKVWKWILGIIAFIVLLGGMYTVYVYKQVTDTAKEIHEPLVDRPASEKRDEGHVDVEKAQPFSVLVLGVDEREGDAGRSDTMIVMTVNPNTNSSKMVSIPRDTYTEIVGRGIQDKINHSYAFGGVRMAMDTTENLLDIPIDYVVQVNMESFKDIVDAVGGITVNNTFSFSEAGFNYPEGKIALNGEEALAYVRMRKQDPNGDFGRQDRQKQVIQGVIREGMSVNSVLKLNSILDAVGDNVRTNMAYSEMVDVQANYRSAAGKIDQLYFEKGSGDTINGIWYYIMNDAELASVQNELKQHLELE
ncbi:LytR family transcriptional regulator [Chryseomicrobium excrementi]|uniref:Polyisoprenyl-teichoic acid--peptidoglycan teichoic acid transferase TagU n=1 Tax=Chryseomicrobium excrementi TaxID=2041346 RepID=A0A2M9F0B8_9BACL|nr:LCP family protein [Chryseomicrobium excrementi]PJK16903.1 LytR family transcriptional regulator [Chryseomicrobium excrementi]